MDKAKLIGWILFGLIFGWSLGTYFHPYELCERKYNTPEDVMECVWLLENN